MSLYDMLLVHHVLMMYPSLGGTYLHQLRPTLVVTGSYLDGKVP